MAVGGKTDPAVRAQALVDFEARRAMACPRASSIPSRRGYESRMDLADAPTVLAQLATAFEHFNEVHPHSSLMMRSPREFRRQRYIANRPGPVMRGKTTSCSNGRAVERAEPWRHRLV